jgi:hypothetical protein
MQTQPERQPGLLMGPGPDGWWDSERLSGPRVLLCADGVWRMWYYGRDAGFDREINLPTGRCGLATSPDGLHWERVRGPLTQGAVLEPHPDTARFDSGHVGVSDVAQRDGLYWMWYFGGDQQRIKLGTFEVKGLQLRPGLAVSGDGLHWMRLEGPWRGALMDVGAPGKFDMATVGWPTVLRGADGVWRMYYHTLDMLRGGVFVIGLAESADGLTWERRGEVLGAGAPGAFDEKGAATRHVVRQGSDYLMFYEGVSADGHRSMGLAVSPDGVRWSREPGNEPDGSVFAHAPAGSGRWDAFAVGTPCLVPLADGSWRMYYIGSNEVAAHGNMPNELALKHQIGLAVSDGRNLRSWKRW